MHIHQQFVSEALPYTCGTHLASAASPLSQSLLSTSKVLCVLSYFFCLSVTCVIHRVTFTVSLIYGWIIWTLNYSRSRYDVAVADCLPNVAFSVRSGPIVFSSSLNSAQELSDRHHNHMTPPLLKAQAMMRQNGTMSDHWLAATWPRPEFVKRSYGCRVLRGDDQWDTAALSDL